MPLFLLCWLSLPASAASVRGWSVGLSTGASDPLSVATALTPHAGAWAVVLDQAPVVWRWDGLATFDLPLQIAENGVANAVAVHDGHLFVGGLFWNPRVVHGDDVGAARPEYFAAARIDLETGDIEPVIGPCDDGNACGEVLAFLPVEREDAWDGIWAAGSNLADESLALWPVAHIAPIAEGTYLGYGVPGLGADQATGETGSGLIEAHALDLGVDPDPALPSGTVALAVAFDGVEDGTWGVARYHGEVLLPAEDLDADRWSPVEGGLPWSGHCGGGGSGTGTGSGMGAGSGGELPDVCVDAQARGLAYFQGQLIVAGTFSVALPAGGDPPVDVDAVAAWDGSAWSAVEDAGAVLDGISGGYTRLLADEDQSLYLFNAQAFGTALPSQGVVAWDGGRVAGLQGGVHAPDGPSDWLGGRVLAAALDADRRLFLGGQFTHVGHNSADPEVHALVDSRGVACFDPSLVCDADLDGDGAVNAADLSMLLGAWGSATDPANIDGLGGVDAADLSILLGTWGVCR